MDRSSLRVEDQGAERLPSKLQSKAGRLTYGLLRVDA